MNVAPTYRARILVADDNRDAADTLSAILELDGHEVRTAYDGVEALKIAEQFAPRIALLDIGMPHLDDYQTARRIRDQSWGSSMLLVALTGWGQEQVRGVEQRKRDSITIWLSRGIRKQSARSSSR